MYSSSSHSPSTAGPRAQGSTGLYHGAKRNSEEFEDSGFFEEDSIPATLSPGATYDDFVLYPDDVPFIDEEASIRPNHGSIYQDSNTTQTSQPSKITFYDPIRQQDNNVRPVIPGNHTVYQQVDSDRPSLFGQFQQVSSVGHDPLSHWVVQPWRHESRAVHFESLPRSREDDQDSIRLSPEPVPPPSSPKHRKLKSGSSKSGRRRKH